MFRNDGVAIGQDAFLGTHTLAADMPWVGGLISLSANTDDIFRVAAGMVDKVLKAAKPADLPVEQPSTFELIVNLKTARALGLTVPAPILVQATEIVE